MRIAPASTALAAGVLLLGGLLSGCSGDDDSSAQPGDAASAGASAGTSADGDSGSGTGSSAPKDADTQTFCSTYGAIVKNGDTDLAAEKEAIDELAKIGTPKDMPADARTGYELLINAISTAKSSEELSKLGEELSQTDTDKLLSFSQYLTTTCADELGVGSGATPSAE